MQPARSVQSTLARRGHVFLALDKRVNHLTQLLQAREHDAISLNKAVAVVLDLGLLAELADQSLRPAQIVARHAREQVVHSLELEAAVEPVEPGRAVDVHGGAELALGEGFFGAQVGGGHRPVGKRDLHVQDDGHGVAEEDETHASRPVGQRQPHELITE